MFDWLTPEIAEFLLVVLMAVIGGWFIGTEFAADWSNCDA